MSKDIYYSDATQLAEMIRSREISPVEVVQAHIERINATNPDGFCRIKRIIR